MSVARLALALLLGACAGDRIVLAPPQPVTALDEVNWIAGDWLYEDERGAEHWTRAGGVIWGVMLADERFEVMAIDGGGDGGALRLTPAPGGVRSVSFTRTATGGGATSATFTNPTHDDPTSIAYARHPGTGKATERLVATVDGPGGARSFPMTAIYDPPVASPEVAAAAVEHVTWSRRSLPEGKLAATLVTDGRTSHLAIWSNRDGSGWTVVYEDRRP